MSGAKQDGVINPTTISQPDASHSSFWQRIFSCGPLQSCGDLEKLVIGCEIIAAMDDPELLAA